MAQQVEQVLCDRKVGRVLREDTEPHVDVGV